MNLIKIKKVPPNQVPMKLLLEADPSESNVRKYLFDSHCYLAEISNISLGVYVIRPLNHSCYELMNIAVTPASQNKGIGKKLLNHSIYSARELGAKRLEVCTGSFGYQLTFYQKAGFRVFSIDKDFFLNHYDEPIFESGIQLKDMIRLTIEL